MLPARSLVICPWWPAPKHQISVYRSVLEQHENEGCLGLDLEADIGDEYIDEMVEGLDVACPSRTLEDKGG